jgi:hypothetical protein
MISQPSSSSADARQIRYLMTELPEEQQKEIEAGLRSGLVHDPIFRRHVAALFRARVNAEGGRTVLLQHQASIQADMNALRKAQDGIILPEDTGGMLDEVEADAEADLAETLTDAKNDLNRIERGVMTQAEAASEEGNTDQIAQLRRLLADRKPPEPSVN